jgi:hypothetical protein
MARETILVSYLRGKTLDEQNVATATIRHVDARRGHVARHVNAEEVGPDRTPVFRSNRYESSG